MGNDCAAADLGAQWTANRSPGCPVPTELTEDTDPGQSWRKMTAEKKRDTERDKCTAAGLLVFGSPMEMYSIQTVTLSRENKQRVSEYVPEKWHMPKPKHDNTATENTSEKTFFPAY